MNIEIGFSYYHKAKLRALCSKLSECGIDFFDYDKVCNKIDRMILPVFMRRVYHSALLCNNLYLEWFNSARDKRDFCSSLGKDVSDFEGIHKNLKAVHEIIHS